MFYRTLAISYLSLSFLYTSPLLAEDKDLTEEDIQQMVADFIKDNPALIRESLTELSKSETEEAQKEQAVTAQKMKNTFANEQDDLVLGNPEASQMVVFFSDPNCGHCRDHYKTLQKVVSKNNDVKVLMKEIPLFGNVSEQAIRAIVAAHKQEKGLAFYEQLALKKPGLEIYDLMHIAEKLNLNEKKFTADMETADTSAFIQKNKTLATQMGINAAPVSIVYSKMVNKPPVIVQGAIPFDVVEGLIQGKTLDTLLK